MCGNLLAVLRVARISAVGYPGFNFFGPTPASQCNKCYPEFPHLVSSEIRDFRT
jgi:hypothetical protein